VGAICKTEVCVSVSIYIFNNQPQLAKCGIHAGQLWKLMKIDKRVEGLAPDFNRGRITPRSKICLRDIR
jgi:hypothetical protein